MTEPFLPVWPAARAFMAAARSRDGQERRQSIGNGKMTPFPATNKAGARAWRARGAAAWLALAASPTFALMAWIAANDAPPIALCSSGSGIMPIGGMTAMYLLMSLFHLSPWLTLASGGPLPVNRGRAPNR